MKDEIFSMSRAWDKDTYYVIMIKGGCRNQLQSLILTLHVLTQTFRSAHVRRLQATIERPIYAEKPAPTFND